jgi:hypothetical protein
MGSGAGIMKFQPGQPCCVGICDECSDFDTTVNSTTWSAVAGTWSWPTGHATTASDDAKLVRTNTASVYRVAVCRFAWESGTKADMTVYFGMQDSVGDGFRVEVAIDYDTGGVTCTVYDETDSVVDGPETWTEPYLELAAGRLYITVCYDPDYDVFEWGVCSSYTSLALAAPYRAYGTVACTLALRDLVAGTDAMNGQTISVGDVQSSGLVGLLHSDCFLPKVLVKKSPLEFTAVLAGLSVIGGVLNTTGGCGSGTSTYQWTPVWVAGDINGTYSIAGDPGSMYTYEYGYDITWTTLVTVVKNGNPELNVTHYITFSILANIGCDPQTGNTTITVAVLIEEDNLGTEICFPFGPNQPRPDDWEWQMVFSKVYSGKKDFRTLSSEDIPLVSVFPAVDPYLDMSAVTLKLTAVVA